MGFRGTQIAAIIGLAISIYAVYVESQEFRILNTNILLNSSHNLTQVEHYLSAISKHRHSRVYFRCSNLFQAHIPGHVALCDIGKGMSCSRVLTSPWAKMFFGIPNTYLGILFYLAHFIAPFLPIPFRRSMVLLATTVAVSFSFYLIYILYSVLHDFCIVCVSTHIINFTLFVLSFRDWTRGAPQKKRRVD